MAEQDQFEDFDKILFDAVDDALSCLGEKVKSSVYLHLEESFSIEKHEIPCRLNDFSDALEQLFGLGAMHLEILFMKNLYAKIKIASKRPLLKSLSAEITFREYVLFMRRSFEATDNDIVEMGVLSDEQKQLQNY